jgi:hypothetical protein
MKQRIARICLTASGIFFCTGFFVLCACPGWYALAAGFAIVAAWHSAGRTRAWAIVCTAASLILTGLDTWGALQEHHRLIERAQKIEQMRIYGTNTSEWIHTAPK